MSVPSSAANDRPDAGGLEATGAGDTPTREARLVELEAALAAAEARAREAEERAARAEAEAAAFVVDPDPLRELEASIAEAEARARDAEERTARTIAGQRSIESPVAPRRVNFGDVPETPSTSGARVMPAPKVGRLIEGTTDSVIVGGKPKADWSGVDGLAPQRTPFVQRFAPGNANEVKAYALRTTPPDKLKLSKKTKLSDSMPVISLHAKKHGLDSVLHTLHPDNPQMMVYICTDYMRLEFLRVKADMTALMKHWDSYDLMNDTAMTEFLVSACDDAMLRTITPYLEGDYLPAAALLVLICNETEHVSLAAYETIRKELENLNPKGFSGVDIPAYVDQALPIVIKLEKALQLTQMVHIDLIKKLVALEISGFSDKLREQFMYKVMDFYMSNGHLCYGDLMAKLRDLKLHPETILENAKYLYRALASNGLWPASKSKDSKAPPVYLGEGVDPSVQKEFAAFMAARDGTSKDKKKGGDIKCYGCNLPGVKKPDCPNCNPKKDDKKTKDEDKKKNQNEKALKEPAPKAGEPVVKIIDNKIYFYCGTCKRWQSTHLPQDHGKPNTKLTTAKLKELKQEFLAGKTVVHANYCEAATESSFGVNLD